MNSADPIQLISTIYLGDRACKAFLIDSWASEVKMQISCISRIRSESWDYYIDEDLEDGWLVFTQVERLELSPSGPIPNDTINHFSASPDDKPGFYRYMFSVSSGDSGGNLCEVEITIVAKDLFLEPNGRPDMRISR